MDTATVTTLPAAQFLAATRLASAHYHEWASIANERTLLAINLVGGLELLTRVVRAKEGDLWPGIDRPWVDAEGTVVHTTASGRLRWEVYQDGFTRLWVSRPSGDVLCAGVGAPDESGVPESIVISHVDGEFLERHIGTLATAIAALGPLGYGHEQFGEMLAAAIEAVRPLQAPEPEPEPEPMPEQTTEEDDYVPSWLCAAAARR
jgi:hypothetical protein